MSATYVFYDENNRVTSFYTHTTMDEGAYQELQFANCICLPSGVFVDIGQEVDVENGALLPLPVPTEEELAEQAAATAAAEAVMVADSAFLDTLRVKVGAGTSLTQDERDRMLLISLARGTP